MTPGGTKPEFYYHSDKHDGILFQTYYRRPNDEAQFVAHHRKGFDELCGDMWMHGGVRRGDVTGDRARERTRVCLERAGCNVTDVRALSTCS